MHRNEHGQPVGAPLEGWTPPPSPPEQRLLGRSVAVTPLRWEEHGDALYEALATTPAPQWTYMSFGPLGAPQELKEEVARWTAAPDWSPYAIVTPDGPRGVACFLRIQPAVGVIEIGSIVLSPALQRSTAATEAFYLMMKRSFDLGYRRCEWKCDALNAPSRSAAERLGFAYEGTFRQATHYKGRNRDTAWYAITDSDWPALDAAFRTWLAPANFDDDGGQRRSLSAVRAEGQA